MYECEWCGERYQDTSGLLGCARKHDYQDKLRSIGTVTKQGTSNITRVRAGHVTHERTEHWDGRVDATVRPDTVRMKGRAIQAKGGTVVEVTK